MHEVFEQLGLNQNEIMVYWQLVSLGRATLTPISLAADLPLTTVQTIVKRLVARGWIKVGKNKSRQVYEALDSVIIQKILERQTQEVKQILPLLKKIKADRVVKNKIEIYRGKNIVDLLHKALEGKEKIIYEIVAARNFQITIGEKLHFTKNRVERGIELKSLRVEVEEIKKYNEKIHRRELREAKFLPRELNFDASMMMWDQSVAWFSNADEKTAVLIESGSMVQMQKQIFELLWSVSRKMETLVEGVV